MQKETPLLDCVIFSLPFLPPSVNHYLDHKSASNHSLSAAAKAFKRDFPILVRPGQYVIGKRFQVSIRYWMGPKDRGDIDNYDKLLLDCIADAGMMRDSNGKELSDAWIKRRLTEIRDSPEDRKIGPKTEVILRPLVQPETT